MPGFDFSEAAIDAYKAISLHIRHPPPSVIPRDNAERIRDAVLTLENHTAAHLASLLRSEAPSPGSEKHS